MFERVGSNPDSVDHGERVFALSLSGTWFQCQSLYFWVEVSVFNLYPRRRFGKAHWLLLSVKLYVVPRSVILRERFASLQYETFTFVKQNCWHKFKDHICIVGLSIQGHKLRANIFKAKRKTSWNGDDIILLGYFCFCSYLWILVPYGETHERMWSRV